LFAVETMIRGHWLAQGNQARTARWLGISRMTLREKLILWGLHPGQAERGDRLHSDGTLAKKSFQSLPVGI